MRLAGSLNRVGVEIVSNVAPPVQHAPTALDESGTGASIAHLR
jgi:hypothetical protein